ncbi:MAG TPA: winged helix-turn-helix transcriptional regulator, partial [Pseudonocardia sp.]|nr:winged helix-turn-helix transcriptional regulator [Pseudonocardia sp.]
MDPSHARPGRRRRLRGRARLGRQRLEYQLTAKGHDLFPVVVALRQWGEAHFFRPGQPHSELLDRRDGAPPAHPGDPRLGRTPARPGQHRGQQGRPVLVPCVRSPCQIFGDPDGCIARR